MTSCSLIIKYRIREVTSQKTAISIATAVGTGDSVVVYSVGSNSLWKKPWFVHTYTARVESRVEQLQPCRSFSAQRQFFSTSFLQAWLSVYIRAYRAKRLSEDRPKSDTWHKKLRTSLRGTESRATIGRDMNQKQSYRWNTVKCCTVWRMQKALYFVHRTSLSNFENKSN